MSDTIIINNAFVGNYGKCEQNLSHEVINFFKADENKNGDNNYYIYISPYGLLKKEIKKEDIKGILFVRTAGDSMVEVLAKAELDENSEYYTKDITSSNIKKVEVKKDYDNSIADIKYGGVTIQKIHSKNKEGDDIVVTFKVARICLPKKTFYLTYKENVIKKKDVFVIKELNEKVGKKINNESMLVYYDKEKNKDSYAELEKIIKDENKELWKSETETLKYNPNDIEDNDSFFKVTRQQDNEVMFSNTFYYFLSKYPKFSRWFANKILNVDINENDCVFEREKDRMDIRIIDNKSYIIIENKLKSSINGMREYKKTKDNKDEYESNHYEEIKGYIAVNGQYISQLSTYYKKAEENKNIDEIHPFIFLPNYSIIDKEYLKKYKDGEKYEIIKYKDIYKNLPEEFEYFSEKDKIYFNDFKKAIKKHTKDIDDEFRVDLNLRLKQRIEELKNKETMEIK